MEAVFVKSYELTYSHIDWRGVARPAAYFDFMQDAATVHAHMAHLDSGALSAIWVLSRVHAEFVRPLSPYDIVQVSTWCAGIKGASCLCVCGARRVCWACDFFLGDFRPADPSRSASGNRSGGGKLCLC